MHWKLFFTRELVCFLLKPAMKKCPRCKEEKDAELFSKNKRRKDGLAVYCKPCAKILEKESRDRTGHYKWLDGRKQRNRHIVIDYLKLHPCVDCGEGNIIVLDFDHVRGNKTRHVSDMVSRCCSIKTIMEEISKCDVRCANCHRVMTARRNAKHWSNA